MSDRGRAEPAGTVIVRGGIVVYASEGAAALAGRGVEEIVGRRFGEFVAPEDRAMTEDRYGRRMRGEPVASPLSRANSTLGTAPAPTTTMSARYRSPWQATRSTAPTPSKAATAAPVWTRTPSSR